MNDRLREDGIRPLVDEPFRPPGADQELLRRRMGLLVVGMGLGSTAITLVLVELVRGLGFDPMLFFVNYIFAIGAMAVGALAGSGYGLGIWLRDIRLGRGALLGIGLLLAVAWGALHVASWWRHAPRDPSGVAVDFATWFDFITRNLGWEQKDGRVGQAFGGWGYLVRLGEVAGFILGGLMVPLVLKAKPYCEPCQRYLRQRLLFRLPAAAEHRNFTRQKVLDADSAPVRERLEADTAALAAALAGPDAQAVGGIIRTLAPRTGKNRKVRVWRSFIRHRCPGCGTGLLEIREHDGNRNKNSPVARIEAAAAMIAAADAAADELAGLRSAPAAAGTG